jgi:serine protease Do
MGIVSAKNRFLAGKLMAYEDFIQTDAAINQGNSGGPLFNFAGQVIGINSAILNPAMAMNVGFAIPINMAQQIAEQLKSTGRVSRGFLGVATTDFTPERAYQMGMTFQPGALVNVVEPRTPAATAGLRPNDVIIELANRRIDGKDRIGQAIASRRPGETVKIVVMRGRQRVETQAVLVENVDLRSGGVSILGIRVKPLDARETAEFGFGGLRVLGVESRSSASGSLKTDDIIVIVEIGSRRMPATLASLRELQQRVERGGGGRIILNRDGELLVLTFPG